MIARDQKVPLRTLPLFFTTARRSGKKGVTFYWQEHQGTLQVSVVVPKKVASLSTQRTALRRNLYQLMKNEFQTTAVLQQPIQLVLIVERPWLALSQTEQQQTIHSILSSKWQYQS